MKPTVKRRLIGHELIIHGGAIWNCRQQTLRCMVCGLKRLECEKSVRQGFKEKVWAIARKVGHIYNILFGWSAEQDTWIHGKRRTCASQKAADLSPFVSISIFITFLQSIIEGLDLLNLIILNDQRTLSHLDSLLSFFAITQEKQFKIFWLGRINGQLTYPEQMWECRPTPKQNDSGRSGSGMLTWGIERKTLTF